MSILCVYYNAPAWLNTHVYMASLRWRKPFFFPTKSLCTRGYMCEFKCAVKWFCIRDHDLALFADCCFQGVGQQIVKSCHHSFIFLQIGRALHPLQVLQLLQAVQVWQGLPQDQVLISWLISFPTNYDDDDARENGSRTDQRLKTQETLSTQKSGRWTSFQILYRKQNCPDRQDTKSFQKLTWQINNLEAPLTGRQGLLIYFVKLVCEIHN